MVSGDRVLRLPRVSLEPMITSAGERDFEDDPLMKLGRAWHSFAEQPAR